MKFISSLILAILFISCGKTPTITVVVLHPPLETEDKIKINGIGFEPGAIVIIEGHVDDNTGVYLLGHANVGNDGSFSTSITTLCSGMITPKILYIEAVPQGGGSKASSKTDRPVCYH